MSQTHNKQLFKTKNHQLQGPANRLTTHLKAYCLYLVLGASHWLDRVTPTAGAESPF